MIPIWTRPTRFCMFFRQSQAAGAASNHLCKIRSQLQIHQTMINYVSIVRVFIQEAVVSEIICVVLPCSAIHKAATKSVGPQDTRPRTGLHVFLSCLHQRFKGDHSPPVFNPGDLPGLCEIGDWKRQDQHLETLPSPHETSI
jgi:hypothetical protein